MGGSHDTAKFIVIVFGNDASSQRWEHNQPERLGRRSRTPVRARYVQFSWLLVWRLAVRLDGRWVQGVRLAATTMWTVPTSASAMRWDRSADLDRNAIGFLRDLRTTFRRRGKNHERDHRPPHRGSVGSIASL